jgi:hypothetical protein
LENDSGRPRDLSKNRHSDSLKRVNLLFLRGVEDVVDVADADDEVRTSTSQYCVRATLCTEEFFFKSQFKYVTLPSYQQIGVGGGRK